MPRLVTFKAAHPAVAIELETNHRGIDPDGRDFDAWLAYTGETAAPRPVTSREDTLLEETLYEKDLLPVCSPSLRAALGRPDGPADLDDWPLLYDLGWDADWSYWCARQGQSTPDLSRASGFRLYSMLISSGQHSESPAQSLRRRMMVDPETAWRSRPPRHLGQEAQEPAAPWPDRSASRPHCKAQEPGAGRPRFASIAIASLTETKCPARGGMNRCVSAAGR